MRKLILLVLPLLAGCAMGQHAATRPAPAPAAGVVKFDVEPGFVQGLADERHAMPLTDWPLYENTNMPVMGAPAALREHAATMPAYAGPDLGLYRVTTMTIDGRKTYVFYHQLSKTLVVVPAP